MYKFDVRYTFDNYLEYYKFVLIKQRIIRDLVFALLFIAVAIYWWVDTSENTANNLLPIFAIIMGVVFPLMNFMTLPMLKKQLHKRQDEIDRTHIIVTFGEDEVVYENLTEKPETNKPVVEETPATEEEQVQAEVVEDQPAEEVVEQKPAEEEQRVFKLNYNNFLQIRETKGLFLFFLDKQTVIILPKESYTVDSNLTEFKNFILSKVNPRRVKFLKEKVEK